jgi:hypothetical protein
MAKGPEGKLYDQCIKFLVTLKKLGTRLWWVKMTGSPYLPKGLPDLWIIVEGRLVLVELKRPDGKGILSPRQSLIKEKIEAAGIKVWIVSSVDEFMQIVTDSINGRMYR